MITHPIHKFTCNICNYTTQVVRERYFEKSCKQDIDNRKCTHCNRLFLAAVTEKAIRTELPNNEESARMFAEDKDKYMSLVSSYMNWENPIPGAELEKIKCLWCGSLKNEKWESKKSICPKCGGKLKRSKANKNEMAKVSDFTSFEEMIKSSLQVVACLFDNWCVPCNILRPVIDEINMENPNEFRFIEFDIDYAERNDLVHKYELKHFPTFLLFKNGEYKGKFSNVDTKPEMLKKMRNRFEKNEAK